MKFTRDYDAVQRLHENVEAAYNDVKDNVNEFEIWPLLHLEHLLNKFIAEFNALWNVLEFDVEKLYTTYHEVIKRCVGEEWRDLEP